MRKFSNRVLLITIVLGLYIGGVRQTSGEDPLMDEYLNAFMGRWVCQSSASQDIEGYWKKGDPIHIQVTQTPMPDRSGMRVESQYEKDGKTIAKAHGVSAWNAADKVIKTFSFAPPSFSAEGTITKDGEKWVLKGTLTHSDGRTSTATNVVTVSDNGNTHTNVLVEGVDKTGQPMDKITRVWKRISKNEEELEKKLGWIIGTWTGDVDIPGMGTVESRATYKWTANKNVIQMNLALGAWEGLSIIFYDPSDGRIKMWGADSLGGNGQAVLTVKGDELIWTNTSYDADGTKMVSDYSYVRQPGGTSFVVKFVDDVDGKEKQITVNRQ